MMFEMTIEGNSYNDTVGPNFTRVQAYNYNVSGTIINTSAFSTDPTFTIDLFHYNGFVCAWFAQTGSFQTYTIKLISFDNKTITSITNAAKPTTGVTNSVTITPYKLWAQANDGAGSGMDADLLDGQHGSYYATASSVAGTLNYVPKFTSSSAIGNSQIIDNGTTVTIGSTTSSLLQIGGSSGSILKTSASGGNIQVRNNLDSDFAPIRASMFVGQGDDRLQTMTAGQPWQLLTGAGSALGLKVGNLVVSNSYSDTAPTNGLLVRGNAQIGALSANGLMTLLSSGAGNVSVLSLFKSGDKEGYIGQTSSDLCIGNSGGLVTYTETTIGTNASIVIDTSNNTTFRKRVEIFGIPEANKFVIYNNATKDYVRFAINSDTGEARFAGVSGDLYIRPYDGSTSITGGTLALNSTASTMSFVTNFGTTNNSPLSLVNNSCFFSNNSWHGSGEGWERFFFLTGSTTYIS